MKIIGILTIALMVCGVLDASAAEYGRYTGVLMHGRDGAVLVSDDGNVYQVPGIGQDFLNRHAGRRVTLVGSASLMTGSGSDTAVIQADEIIVTAPRMTTSGSSAKSTGTKAGEAARLVVPPLIPPF